jgi:hypothetical protein
MQLSATCSSHYKMNKLSAQLEVIAGKSPSELSVLPDPLAIDYSLNQG